MDHREALVRDALARLDAHDVEGYLEHMTDDVVSTTPVATCRGKDEFRGYLTRLDGIPDHWRRIERLVVSGDSVATWLTFGGTVAVTGRSFEMEGCTVWDTADGRIRTISEWFDVEPMWTAAAPAG